MDVCPLCRTSDYPIRVSHVIPNAAFKRAKDNGKMMKVDVRAKLNYLVQDSWATEMLCSECEHLFNTRYEEITLNELRVARKRGGESGLLKLKTKNPSRLAAFMMSLVWRAAVSSHSAYKKVRLPNVVIEGVRQCLLYGSRPDVLWTLSYRITAMYDSKGVFDVDAVSRIIASPCLSKLSALTFSFVFMFEGYKFEVIFTSEKQAIDQAGVIKPIKSTYKLARQCLWSDKSFGKTYRDMHELAQSNK
jgi:hypothetical protein